MSRRIRVPALLLAAAVVGACDKTQEPRVPTTIHITPGSWSLSETASRQFVATVRDQNGDSVAGTKVVWQSDHPELVMIDSTGMATAISSFIDVATLPAVTLTATSGPLSATATIALTRMGTFDAYPDTNRVYPGMTRALTTRLIRQMSAIGHPDPPIFDVIPTSSVQWSSSDARVVTVSSAGTMTFVAAGHAQVIAKYQSSTDTVDVNVIAAPAVPLRFTSVTSDAPNLGRQGAGNVFAARGCGVVVDGSIYCWGATLDSTQLSDRCEATGPGGVSGIKLFRYRCSEIPLRVQTDVKFTSVAITGGEFTNPGASGCGLATTRRVHCWGANRKGELGIGTTDLATHAVAPIAGTDEFNELRSWGGSVCGIRTDGVLRCWGNVFGPSPVTVGAGITWRALAEASGCGLATDSTAYCFGSGTAQQLGGATRWKAISSAGLTCALALDDSVYCGSNLQDKQAIAQSVVRLGTYAQGMARDAGFGGVSTCGLTSAGDLQCANVAWAVVPAPVKLTSFFGLCAIGVDQKVYCRLDNATIWVVVPGQ